jgi:F1F0 ATPase subunit 2
MVFSTLVGTIPAFIAGMVLGAFYFGCLWLTVKRLPQSSRPALLTLGSFFGRMAVVLAGFYLVTEGHWERLAAAMIGFLTIRAVAVRFSRPRARSVPEMGCDASQTQ